MTETNRPNWVLIALSLLIFYWPPAFFSRNKLWRMWWGIQSSKIWGFIPRVHLLPIIMQKWRLSLKYVLCSCITHDMSMNDSSAFFEYLCCSFCNVIHLISFCHNSNILEIIFVSVEHKTLKNLDLCFEYENSFRQELRFLKKLSRLTQANLVLLLLVKSLSYNPSLLKWIVPFQDVHNEHKNIVYKCIPFLQKCGLDHLYHSFNFYIKY